MIPYSISVPMIDAIAMLLLLVVRGLCGERDAPAPKSDGVRSDWPQVARVG